MKGYMSVHEFERVYDTYKDLLYRIGFTYLKNEEDVADLLQDVFVRRWKAAPTFESSEHEKRWMIRVTVNLAKNQIKSIWKKKVDKVEEVEPSSELLQWHMNERDKEVYEGVMALPEKQRIVIYLHYFEGYTCKEISQILHCKESAVKMRLKKGRELFKKEWKQEGMYENQRIYRYVPKNETI